MAPGDVPSLEGTDELWEAAEAEEAFWQAHYAEFLERYPDQFVAVLDGKVVATSPDLQQIIQVLESKHLEPRRVWVRFITADPQRILL